PIQSTKNLCNARTRWRFSVCCGARLPPARLAHWSTTSRSGSRLGDPAGHRPDKLPRSTTPQLTRTKCGSVLCALTGARAVANKVLLIAHIRPRLVGLYAAPPWGRGADVPVKVYCGGVHLEVWRSPTEPREV